MLKKIIEFFKNLLNKLFGKKEKAPEVVKPTPEPSTFTIVFKQHENLGYTVTDVNNNVIKEILPGNSSVTCSLSAGTYVVLTCKDCVDCVFNVEEA